MEVTLEHNYYAFSVARGMTAVVTVNDGTLDYSHQSGGPFRSEGSIGAGESRDFDFPGVLLAFEEATFDIEYPQPGIEGLPPLPEGEGS